MSARAAAIILLLSQLLCGCAYDAGNSKNFAGLTGFIGDARVPLDSWQQRKFISVVRQKYDFSCGSAALATLLTYQYNEASTEAEVFQGMWRDGDRSQIRRVGFSLLDMKRYLATRGIVANGFRVGLDRILAAGIPGIALITIKRYRHFVVVKGISQDRLLLGDPSLGLRLMRRSDFVNSWNGVYFVLTSVPKGYHVVFNAEAQWKSAGLAPVGGEFTNPLSQQQLWLSAPLPENF